jgi:hypothetical protein
VQTDTWDNCNGKFIVLLVLYIVLNLDPLRRGGTEEDQLMFHQMTLFWHTHVTRMSFPCFSTQSPRPVL